MSKLHKASCTVSKAVSEQNHNQTFERVCTASSISTFADLLETCRISAPLFFQSIHRHI